MTIAPVAGERGMPRFAGWIASVSRIGVLELLLLATVATISFTKFYFEPIGKLALSNIFGVAYVAAFAGLWLRRSPRIVPRSAATLGCFLAALAAVYAAGFLGIESAAGRTQFFKAFATWIAQSSFMLCAAMHMSAGGMRLIRRAVVAFVVGFCVNAAFGIAQFVGFMGAGINIDAYLIEPLPFSDGIGGILKYGGGIYRINGLTRDPNHLGVMLAAPLVLAATWLEGRKRAAAIIVLTGGLVLSLSRSGLVAAFAALMVLAWPWRRKLLTRTALTIYGAGIAAACISLAYLLVTRPDVVNSLIISRLDPNQGSAQTHIRLYGLIPDMMARAPIFGNGMNSFALLFEDVTAGREGFGPHSLIIQLLVETGMVGFVVFMTMLGWLTRRCMRIGDVRAWGIAAAIIGTVVGNLFYLTVQIMYDDFLYALAAAIPVAIGIHYNRTTTAVPQSTSAGSTPGSRQEQP